MTDQAISTYGQLDILVNAAGNLRLGTIVDTTPEDFDAIIRVHLRGYYNTSHFAARHWVERGEYGRLINFISMAALVSYPSLLAYSSAKAGIVGLTRSSANALVSYNVTANCVRPSASTGMSDTDDPASRLLYERSGKLASEQAVGTLADPEHMVPLIVYLASPAAGHISGRLFEGRGGHYALWSEPAPERILNCDFLSDPQQTYDGLEKELGAGLTLQDLKAPMPPLDELGDWKTKYGTLVPTWDFRRGV
jgi:3-oxoacyl-[acyl-carrier protein] reductase